MGAKTIDRAVADYAELHPQLVSASDAFVRTLRELIDEAGINYLTIEGRAKSVPSFAGKALRLKATREDVDPLSEITDQVGVRVITYVQSDIVAVAELLAWIYRLEQRREATGAKVATDE